MLRTYEHPFVGEEVIDEDFRNNVSVLLYSHSENPYIVRRADRIKQWICEKVYYPELYLMKKMDDTWRVTNEFGSTEHA